MTRWTMCKRGLPMLTLVGAAAGCRTAPIYVPAVQAQLAVQPAEVRAGDTVRITVTVANPGPDTVALEFGDEECPVTFTVLDETDRAVPIAHDAAGCLAAEQERLVLPPGGTWRVDGRWHASLERGAPLPPGAYVVAAVLGEHDSVVRGKREYKMGSGAGRVPLRVLPAHDTAGRAAGPGADDGAPVVAHGWVRTGAP